MLYANTGLNITLNLPILRVSPDHGPAYNAILENKIYIRNIIKSFQFAFQYQNKWASLYSYTS